MLYLIHLKYLFNALGLLLKARGNEDDRGHLGRQTHSLDTFVLNLLIDFVGLVQGRLFQVQSLSHILDGLHSLGDLFILGAETRTVIPLLELTRIVTFYLSVNAIV